MSAGTYTIFVEQNADYPVVFTWSSGGNPVNLTGYTARLQVQDSSNNVLVDLSTENGGLVLGGAAGTITPKGLNAAATALLTAGKIARYDLILTSPGGIVTRLLEGPFIIDAGVTPLPS